MQYEKTETFVPATRPKLHVRAGKAVATIWQAYLDWLTRQAARRTLYELDDRMLKDIGISRAEIEAVARGYHPRRL